MNINFTALVAMDRNGVIGKDNTLPWKLPSDLREFKNTTIGGVVVMGRKTFESIGSKPLPQRINIVLSRSPIPIGLRSDVIWVNSPHRVIELCRNELVKYSERLFVIGGSEIYQTFMPWITELRITKVDTEIEGGDAVFPRINAGRWTQMAMRNTMRLPGDEHAYTVQVLQRNRLSRRQVIFDSRGYSEIAHLSPIEVSHAISYWIANGATRFHNVGPNYTADDLMTLTDNDWIAAINYSTSLLDYTFDGIFENIEVVTLEDRVVIYADVVVDQMPDYREFDIQFVPKFVPSKILPKGYELVRIDVILYDFGL